MVHEMTHVLTVFIDGLKPESIEYMPFLDTFSVKKKVKTELGYSITCHASMYSGVHPDKHLRWFIWKYSPETSPFRWIKTLRLHRFENFYLKYFCYKLTGAFKRNTAFTGIPFLAYTPLKYWAYFDVSEKKFWSEPGFLEKYPTIFDILRANKVPYDIVGMVRKHVGESSKIVAQYNPNKIKPWTYLFIGDVDPLSHKYGQDSIQVRSRLREIDSIIEEKYKLFERESGDFCFMLFSDHGHIAVKGRVNLKSFFRERGKRLDDYIHFIDANYARFWFRNEKEREEVSEILSEVEEGFILTEEHFKKYHVNMPDNRYGDLIFYLDTPYIFDKGNIYVMGKKWSSYDVSMHGYLPDTPNYDGVFISNKEVKNISYVQLVDIMPSILKVLGLKIPDYVDGEVIWK